MSCVHSLMASARPIVGFDLDMTLLDSRAGIKATYDERSHQTGVTIDSAPVQQELAHWFPTEDVQHALARDLQQSPRRAIEPSAPMPGAQAALAAVGDHHGRSVALTAKHQRNAQLHLQHLGLDVDEVVGAVQDEAKSSALAERGAAVYVGDDVLDVEAARATGATSVAICTGYCTARRLTDAGADVVLPDLRAFPAWFDEHLLDTRMAGLESRLHECGRLLVAFSGGADSAFLLAAAVRMLGKDNVIAATAMSDSLPQAELTAAREFAAGLGVRHLTPQTREMERRGYRANGGDRCYFCKSELIDVLAPLAADERAKVATGTNADDVVAGFRPGIRAAAERGAVTPLRDAGFTKRQVREVSRRWKLPTWDKPAAACLSSRIAYGVEVTPYRLARVERAEAGLRSWLEANRIQVGNLRVRDLDNVARIEVDPALIELVRDSVEAQRIVRDAGFREVEIDERGFRSGSMNELLSNPESYR